MDPDLRSRQEARDLLRQARAVQKLFLAAGRQEVDRIVEAMVCAAGVRGDGFWMAREPGGDCVDAWLYRERRHLTGALFEWQVVCRASGLQDRAHPLGKGEVERACPKAFAPSFSEVESEALIQRFKK